MFEQSCLEYAEDHRRMATLLSFGIQLFALSLLVVLPVLYTQALPRLLFSLPARADGADFSTGCTFGGSAIK